jgi:hypothetical protein
MYRRTDQPYEPTEDETGKTPAWTAAWRATERDPVTRTGARRHRSSLSGRIGARVGRTSRISRPAPVRYWISRRTPRSFPDSSFRAISYCGRVLNAEIRVLTNRRVSFRRTGRRLQGQRINMRASKSGAYRAFRAFNCAAPIPLEKAEKVHTEVQARPPLCRAPELNALPPLAFYQRCTCGTCRECRDYLKWDRIFAKFEVKEREVRGMYGCALENY